MNDKIEAIPPAPWTGGWIEEVEWTVADGVHSAVSDGFVLRCFSLGETTGAAWGFDVHLDGKRLCRGESEPSVDARRAVKRTAVKMAAAHGMTVRNAMHADLAAPRCQAFTVNWKAVALAVDGGMSMTDAVAQHTEKWKRGIDAAK